MRPGADCVHSLKLLKDLKAHNSNVPTKSSLMVGLGETDGEILEVMRDMCGHDIDTLTISQCLAPSGHHLPMLRYVYPNTFKVLREKACKMGFTHTTVGAMTRGSYHTDQQIHEVGVV